MDDGPASRALDRKYLVTLIADRGFPGAVHRDAGLSMAVRTHGGDAFALLEGWDVCNFAADMFEVRALEQADFPTTKTKLKGQINNRMIADFVRMVGIGDRGQQLFNLFDVQDHFTAGLLNLRTFEPFVSAVEI